jgi:transcriptional regulator with XRE-family HTH domain
VPKRLTPVDGSIGGRIRARRQLRGWSVRFTADRAGLTHASLSRIERGLQSADNRFVLADIAAALECSVAELTGQPIRSVDQAGGWAQGKLPAVRAALVETDLTYEPTIAPRPLPELQAELSLLQDLRFTNSDFVGLGARLPRLLRELHATVSGPRRAVALRLLIEAVFLARDYTAGVGYPGDAWIAADRCRQVAEATADPTMLAFAEWTRALVCTGTGMYSPALTIATRAVDELQRHHDRTPMLGILQLIAAFASRGVHQASGAASWLAEATATAAHTGETTDYRLFFGPTNARIWAISMEVDGGDPGKAVELAQGVNPMAITARNRQATYYEDTGRALARLGQPAADASALRMILTAERLAPQSVRMSTAARETARGLLERSQRRAGGSELRGLCERLGLGV